MSVADLTPEMAGKLGLDADRGVVITEVATNGVAERAGLRAGDVILQVQGGAVPSARQFQMAVAKYDLQRGVRLLARRGAQQFVRCTALNAKKRAARCGSRGGRLALRKCGLFDGSSIQRSICQASHLLRVG